MNHPEQRRNNHPHKVTDRNSGATRKRTGYLNRQDANRSRGIEDDPYLVSSAKLVDLRCTEYLMSRGLIAFWS